MESLLALLVAVTLIFRSLGRDWPAMGFFGVSVAVLVVLLRFHATDALKLNF